MSKQILKDIDKLIDDLKKEIKEKNDLGLKLIDNIKTQIKENPDYLFPVEDSKYNIFMDKKEKDQTSVMEISNDLDEKIKKLENIKLIINDHIEINNNLGQLINNQRIGSLLHHSVKESEKFIKDNKLKVNKTIIPELIKNANFTIKNSKKEGGNLKRKQSRRRNK